MTCPRCRHENPPGLKFCGECGARLAAVCASCGASNAPAQKFCGECGAALAQGAPAAKAASPEAYTPQHLAEKILTTRAALEGERKQVTVLFADLKGSMELLADRDPEEARKLLDPVIEHMMEAVHRYEGTVNQVMGDGIMALFGAPLAHEDHAVRACYAALRMQESVGRYGDEIQRSHGLPVQIRIGLNSGEVVVRSIGSDLHMDYTAVGQTTHLAGRMEQMAKPGTVLATSATLRLAEGYVRARSLGPVPVKGIEAPVEVYELAGAVPVRSRMEAAAARGLTRFVGREAELEALRQALERARAGHGQIAALVGEPGVGKSRLFWEFIHSHRTHGWLLLETSSASYGKATPYLPIIDLLKAYCQIEPRDDGRKIREKLTGKLLTLDRALEPALPAFLALLDVPGDDARWQALDPPQRRQRTLEALKRLVLRESQVQPVCLALEDLHWIDSETQGFLDSLIESLPTARILLLVNYRPEYQHTWGSKSYYAQLRIDPLPPENAEQLLGTLLGTDPGLEPLKQRLFTQTQGNPFFLEESVRTLVETQVLSGERGAYRLAKALPQIQVPATVQAVLAARIDRLPPEEKRLLQAAAVIGEEVPLALLHAIAEVSEVDLRRALGHLQAGEFLYEARLFPDLEYTFKHGLTYQVAYGSLLQDRRRTLHARIAEALERLYPDRIAEHVERLAHHASRGEVWEQAVRYLRQAGTKAFARSALREAVEQFEQALSALAHLPDSRDARELAIDLRFDLRHALMPLGEFERLRDHLRQAEALAESLGDQGRLGRVFTYLANYHVQIGDPGPALECAQRALAIAERLGDIASRIVADFRVGQAHHALGEYRRASRFLRRAAADLKGDRTRDRLGMAGFPAAISRGFLAWCLAEVGEFAEGIALADEAMQLADEVGQAFTLTSASRSSGCVHIRKGDIRKAVAVLERGLRICREHEVPVWSLMIASHLGYAYTLSGRVAEALPLLEHAREQAAAERVEGFPTLSLACLGDAYLHLGRVDDAAELGAAALRLCRERKERGHEAWALRLLGEIALGQDRPDLVAADARYGAAMALASELGMRPLVAHCHLGLARLHRRTGAEERAAGHLATAMALYREMDMRFWLDEAETA